MDKLPAIIMTRPSLTTLILNIPTIQRWCFIHAIKCRSVTILYWKYARCPKKINPLEKVHFLGDTLCILFISFSMPVDFYVKVSVCPCPRCVWLLVFIGPLYDHKTNIPPSLQMIIAIITSVASQTRLLVTTVLSQSEASIGVTWPALTNQRPGGSPWNCHLQLSRVRGELQRVGRWLIVVSVKTGIRDTVTNNFPPERVIEKGEKMSNCVTIGRNRNLCDQRKSTNILNYKSCHLP